MEHAKPSIGYVILSYLLTETQHNVIITTNFDHLAEDAVSYYEQTIPLVIGHESLAHYATKQIARPTIIKIHRDLLLDPKNRADELEKLHENWQEALGKVFSEYHPIFIGYAGNDNSLMDFLEKTQGYLIKHDGFDEVMCLLGEAFDYELLSKAFFLDDAEKRFQMLSNGIDKFIEISISKEKSKQEETLEETVEVSQAVEKITSQADQQRLYREAIILHNSGKYEEAEEIVQQLIELNPKNPRYHNFMGGLSCLRWQGARKRSRSIRKR